jgi:PAS domain S-box-containing protein
MDTEVSSKTDNFFTVQEDMQHMGALAEKDRLQFVHLPKYASYLLEEKTQEIALAQLQILKSLKIPILSFITDLPEEKVVFGAAERIKKSFAFLAENRVAEYIDDAVKIWTESQIPQISRGQITVKDLSLISFARRKIFRDFLPYYSRNLTDFQKIMEEVDLMLVEIDAISFKKLIITQHGLYEQAQQLAQIGNWHWDLVNDSLTWSKELFRIYELPPQAKVTYDLASFNHPDDAQMVTHQIEISKLTKQPHDFYYRIVLQDGRQKYLHAKGEVLVSADGKAEKLFGTLQDVTIQKRNEIALLDQQDLVQKIVDLSPTLISIYNIKSNKFLFTNNAFTSILGYDPESIMTGDSKFLSEIIHPEDRSVVFSKKLAFIHNANTQNRDVNNLKAEYRYRLRDTKGDYLWFHEYCAIFERDSDKEVEKILSISISINEQVNANLLLTEKFEELRRNEERYHKMIEEVEDYAVLLLSTEGIIENWNLGAQKIKGYKAEEIIGRNFRIFYTDTDRENKLPERLIQLALQNGKASHEGWRVRKDKSMFWGNILITALHDHEGKVIGFSKVTRDLTQKKLAEDNLRKYTREVEKKNEELEQKNKELESFSFVASHDLQDPLRKIRMLSSHLIDNQNVSPKTQDVLKRIENAAIQMQTFIEGLLHYSQTVMQEDSLEETDLGILLDEVLNEYADSIDERNIIIEKTQLPVVKVIRFQFRQLFSNLISNGIKYCRPSVTPKISITCENVTPDSSHPKDQKSIFYKISFTDNGIGFKQEHADKIFELFQRLHDKSAYKGTGIGLALCKRIVENHKGRIIAVASPEGGASFQIFIPA